MTEPTRLRLRRALVDRYAHLRQRLTNRLGSAALASEALSETWLALGGGGELAPVADPDAYVYRAALNAASALRKRDARHVGDGDPLALAGLADDAPLPERTLIARDEMTRVAAALAELPQRQREAFLECFQGETPPDTVALRWGVSVRTIQADIRTAILHCAARLGRKNVLAGKRVKLSGQ